MHDLSAQIAFILEIDKLKAVYRKTMVKADDNRHENSAEHSWHIALLTASGQEMLNLWLEFEKADSVDAQFAKGMDRVLPIFQNMSNNGGSWKAHNVHKTQVLKRNSYLRSSAPKLWEYVEQQVDEAVKNGWLQNR